MPGATACVAHCLTGLTAKGSDKQFEFFGAGVGWLYGFADTNIYPRKEFSRKAAQPATGMPAEPASPHPPKTDRYYRNLSPFNDPFNAGTE